MRRLWPMFAALSLGRVVYRDRSGKKRLYLTFDDGPCPENTPRLLDLLDEHDAKATFFMVGRRVRQWPEVCAEVVRRGHEVGNHSMTHTRFSWLNPRAKKVETDLVDGLFRELGVVSRPSFRLPYAEDSVRLIAYCALEGHRLALWSRDSLDYRLTGPEVLRRLLVQPPAAGDILLFHDDGPAAATALATLLPTWRASGFSFGRLSDIH